MEVTSALKVAHDRDRLAAYLRGERIFPTTLELDITSRCNRQCANCPSTTRPATRDLDMAFVQRLFSCLEGQTRGLLLSGGEPTLAPHFPAMLREARRSGFTDIAIVTNGSQFGNEAVESALLSDASVVRVSLYDWTEGRSEALAAEMTAVEALRSRIDRTGSALEIGVSVLTSSHTAERLCQITSMVRSAGAHWIYFHPTCSKWDQGTPAVVDQERVLDAIVKCAVESGNGFGVYTLPDRYENYELEFSGYHAAHFLLVIGADGVNYVSAEGKYYPGYAIATLGDGWEAGFLWNDARLRRIESFKAGEYPALGSRHRGSLYSHVIESLKQGEEDLPSVSDTAFRYPHIL
jgi:MoaA/NifB/PqqE/SkfB family radical SAM enzyme